MLRTMVTCALAVCTLATALPIADGDYTIFAGKEVVQLDTLVSRLNTADVVFVGENHDDKRAHALEFAILQGLFQHNPQLTLSLEMFERDTQGVLDEYLDGFITETHFLQASRPWPNYKDDYRPLIEFCKQNHLPVIAANAPRRYVNIVSRGGQEALRPLPRASKAYLAPLPYSMDLPPAYSRQLDGIFGVHDEDVQKQQSGKQSNSKGNSSPDKNEPAKPSSAGPAAPVPTASSSSGGGQTAPAMPSAANMKQAQGLWDATMADSIATYVRRHPGRKVLQINGAMHSDAGYGIVARLRKTLPHLKVMIVTIHPDANFNKSETQVAVTPEGATDFVILTRPEPGKEEK